MKRRRFLKATPIVVTPTVSSSTALASNDNETADVDFEKLITEFYSDLPDDSEKLRETLENVANEIHENGEKISLTQIKNNLASLGDAQSLVRRVQFTVQILHNNDLGQYLDEAWVAAARNNLGTVTRVLPLVTSFNNLYVHAEALDTAVQKQIEVEDAKHENFGYALLAFGIELGFFCSGTPYRMAWKGTRFLSNRTLLRVGHHLDNKVIALVMSEIHWKIREGIYGEVNADNLGALSDLVSSGKFLEYVLGEVDSLKSFAMSGEIKDTYLEQVDLDIDRQTLQEWDLKELSEEGSSGGDDGILP